MEKILEKNEMENLEGVRVSVHGRWGNLPWVTTKEKGNRCSVSLAASWLASFPVNGRSRSVAFARFGCARWRCGSSVQSPARSRQAAPCSADVGSPRMWRVCAQSH